MDNAQIMLRLERIERQLGLGTWEQGPLVRCNKCGEIKRQPLTLGLYPEGFCKECLEKMRKERMNND